MVGKGADAMQVFSQPRRWLVAAVILGAAGYCGAAEFGLDLPVARARAPKPVLSVSAQSVPAGATFDLIADFKLDKTVHLYRDKLVFKWTKLDGAKLEQVILPKGVSVPDILRPDEPGAAIEVYEQAAHIIARLTATAKPGEKIIVAGALEHQSCTDKVCFVPAEEPFAFELTAGEAVATTPPKGAEQAASRPATSSAQAVEGGDLLWRMVLAFLGGIALSLTPCVYPMIPVTAAVIGARKEKGILSALVASLVYVLGLSLVYALIGMLVATPGSEVQSFLQSKYVVIPVSLIFVALAVVMFAGLNFAAPTALGAKLQGMLVGRKGLLSTFALGAVSGIVVGPCVAGPLFGLLVYIAHTGDRALGFWMLFMLAWGMGIPLILFGTATGLMPKAGPWMEWIERLLGFVLLGAAVYFVRAIIGYLAYHIAFALVLVVAAVFLGGFDSLTRESTFGDRVKRVLGIVAVMYAVFLLLSPPPGPNVFKPGTAADVERALADGKPIVLDFSATWCTICEALDKNVFTKREAVDAAKGLVTLEIDFDHEKGLVKKYGVFGPPAIIFIGRDGKVRQDLSFPGEKSLDEFLRLLREFKKF